VSESYTGVRGTGQKREGHTGRGKDWTGQEEVREQLRFQLPEPKVGPGWQEALLVKKAEKTSDGEKQRFSLIIPSRKVTSSH
jgi:hypothetical protein